MLLTLKKMKSCIINEYITINYLTNYLFVCKFSNIKLQAHKMSTFLLLAISFHYPPAIINNGSIKIALQMNEIKLQRTYLRVY